MDQVFVSFIMPYILYIIFIFVHISVAEREEAGELAHPQSDTSQPADMITRNTFSIIVYVDRD